MRNMPHAKPINQNYIQITLHTPQIIYQEGLKKSTDPIKQKYSFLKTNKNNYAIACTVEKLCMPTLSCNLVKLL